MNVLSLPRWAVWLLTPPITAAAVAVIVPQVAEYRAHTRDVVAAEDANGECDGVFSKLAGRFEVQQAVLVEYAAGRIDLRQAGDRFREMYQGDETGVGRLRWAYPAATDDEQLYTAAVVRHLRAADGNPDMVPVCQRAEREFRRMYGGSAAHAVP